MSEPLSFTASSLIEGCTQLIAAAEQRRAADEHKGEVFHAHWTGYMAALHDLRYITTEQAFEHVLATASYDTEEN